MSVLVLRDFSLTINGALMPFEGGEVIDNPNLCETLLRARVPVQEVDEDSYVICPHCGKGFASEPDSEC